VLLPNGPPPAGDGEPAFDRASASLPSQTEDRRTPKPCYLTHLSEKENPTRGEPREMFRHGLRCSPVQHDMMGKTESNRAGIDVMLNQVKNQPQAVQGDLRRGTHVPDRRRWHKQGHAQPCGRLGDGNQTLAL